MTSLPVVLAINAGSSSIKFSIYEADDDPAELARGQVSGIGGNSRLSLRAGTAPSEKRDIRSPDHASALDAILDACGPLLDNRPVAGVGHRIVHGGTSYDRPVILDDATIAQLKALEPLAPLHQPHNLAGIEAARAAFPEAVQVACFDTAFHRSHPWVNDTFALPRRFYDKGVRRYGFHGLSYEYIVGELGRTAPELATGRTVIAHLGNGASMCAVHNGRSIGSTMGFSALDGLPMGTRCGQLDPGVLLYLMETEGMDARAISDLLYRESGLQGLSGLTNDMRELEASGDPRAADAIAYFVFRIRRELGAMAAVLGGLDGLVFTGGIGENSTLVRMRVCEDMKWLGISLDEAANQSGANADIGSGRVRIMVVPTDEERVIARATAGALGREALVGNDPSTPRAEADASGGQGRR